MWGSCLYKIVLIKKMSVTATILFPQFVQYSLSIAGTPKNEIPEAVLELCQLKIRQFSLDILKFSTKQEENPFTLNWFMVPPTFLFIFHAAWRRLGSYNFQNSSLKKKPPVRPVFPDYLSVSYDHDYFKITSWSIDVICNCSDCIKTSILL